MDFKLLMQLVSFIYPNRKDLSKHANQFYDSKYGKNTIKISVIGAYLFCVYYYCLIFGLIWLMFELSMNGFLIGFCSFLILCSVTGMYFDSAFHDLFFSKKNEHKPFSIV